MKDACVSELPLYHKKPPLITRIPDPVTRKNPVFYGGVIWESLQWQLLPHTPARLTVVRDGRTVCATGQILETFDWPVRVGFSQSGSGMNSSSSPGTRG